MGSNDFKRLAALLKQERKSLTEGRLTDLSALLDDKTELLNRLAQAPERNFPKDLMQSLSRNQDLLEAAIIGVRDAQRRVQEVTAIRNGLKTYQGDGNVVDVVFTHHHALDQKE